MNTAERNRLSKEAEMQLVALKRISHWKTIALAISTIGVAGAYAGFAGLTRHTFLGVLGILFIIAGVAGAVVFNLGLKNGRRNVEKILNILDKGRVL